MATPSSRAPPPRKLERTDSNAHALLVSVSDSVLSGERSLVWLRLVQYSLRLSVHLSQGSRRLSPQLQRLLGAIGLLSALRRLLALSRICSAFVRSFVSLSSPSPSATPIQWPSTARYDRVWALGRTREAFETLAVLSDASFLLTSHALLSPVFRLRRLNPKRLDWLASLSALLAAGAGLLETKEVRTRTWTRGRAIRREALAIEGKIKKGAEGLEGDDRIAEPQLRGILKVHHRQLRGLRAELVDLDWEKVMLWAEAIFAGWDVLELPWAHDAIKSYAGLTAAFIATRQAVYRPGAAALSPTSP